MQQMNFHLLLRGELRIIGATTMTEYKVRRRRRALARRFHTGAVDEPTAVRDAQRDSL